MNELAARAAAIPTFGRHSFRSNTIKSVIHATLTTILIATSVLGLDPRKPAGQPQLNEWTLEHDAMGSPPNAQAPLSRINQTSIVSGKGRNPQISINTNFPAGNYKVVAETNEGTVSTLYYTDHT